MNGFELNIGTEMLKRMDEADKKLQQIASHSEEVSKAMKKLSTDGINSVVNGLSKMSTQLSQLSQSKGFSNMGAQASQSVDAINKLVEALAKLTTQQQLRLQTQQAKVDYKKEANDLKELVVAEDERARALNRQNKANIANDKHRQALETKKLANDTKELMNIEQERGRQLILQNQKSIAAYTKQSVKLKQQIDEINRLAKAYKQLPKSIKQGELNKLITSASKAKTINQHIVAIHNLNNSLRDLDTKSTKYKDNVRRINEEIARNRMELAKLGVNLDSVRNKKRKLMDTAGQLGRSLALIFSVSHIMGYVNQMVNIRREMELQHRSLQVLIQDRYEADKLWQQTVDLAVRSPFRVKELVTYTRQLAAYRIESDRLHDTTRRLADVSAGLGVDMNRLILAYGQVRAAEYLRGTELRQFSEAGIPMLDELAKHFEQLEGRAVSAGDVFERVSKRMVSFEDVDEVFQRMTNKGGVFFQMQEKQSETLHGIISNFHDSIDLMLNDLGEANDGFLKGTVLLFRGFVQNWRVFAEILTQIGTAAIITSLYRGVSKLVALSPKIYAMAGALTSLNVANKAISVSMMRLIVSLKALGAAMLTPQGLIIGLVAAVASSVSGFIAWGKAIDAANAKFDKMSEREANSINELNVLNEKIKENNKIIEDNNSKLEEKTKAEEDNAKTLELLKNKYPDVYKGLVAQKNGTIDASKAVEHYNDMLRVNIALQQQAKGSKLQDTFSENYEEALADYQKVVSSITRVQSQALQGIVNATSMLQKGNISQGTFDSITKILGKLSTAETFEDLKLLNNELVAFQNTLLSSQREYSAVIKATSSLREAYSDLYSSQGSYTDSLDDWYGNIDNQMDAFIVGVQKKIKVAANETIGKSLAGDWVTGELKKLGAVNEVLLKKAQNYVKSKLPLGIDITFEEDGQPVYDLKESWRKKIWSAIEAVQASNPDIRLGVTLKEMATKDKSELIRKIQESVDNAMDINDKTIKVGELPFQVAFTDEQIQNAKNAKPLLEFLSQLVGVVKDGNKASTKDWWSEMAKGIQNLRKDFVDLNKTFDENESKQIALERHLGVLKEIIANLGDKGKGIDLGSINFTTEQGTIDALQALKKMLPASAKQARVSIEKALSDITGTIRIRDKELKDQKLIDQIEEMFSGYEMSIELQKLNIPPDLAKQLFNIDSLTLPDLKNKLIELKPKFEGKEMLEEWDKLMKKIDDKENKEQEERLKKYTKYLLKAQSERVKIKLDEMRQLAEIDKEDKYSQDQKETIKRSLRIETQEKLDKEAWDEFKNSEMYTQMFEDLETLGNKAIDNLLDNLEKLKDSLKNLPANEVKEIMTQINKLSDIKNERNPFASLRDAMKEVRALEAQGKTEESLQLELQAADARAKSAQNDIDAIDTILNAKREGLSLDSQSVEWQNKYGRYVGLTVDMLEEEKRELGEILDHNKNISEQSNKGLSSYAKARNALKAVHSEWESIRNMASKAYDSIKTILESMGIEADSTAMVLADIGMSLVDLVFQAISFGVQLKIMTVQAELLGVAINSALGPIGWAVLALQAISTVFSGILGLGDAKKEREIKKEQELVENLEKAYKKLEKAIENAYSISGLESGNAKAQQNIKAQIAAYERMIALEEDKKKTDKDKVKEWKNTIDELREQAEELNKEVVSTATAGIIDSVMDASREFTDAWLEAFNETGDGLSGLESNFKGTMLEMVKQQAAMLISQSYIEKWKEQLKGYINPDDLELSTNEAKKWVNAVTTSLPQLNQALENYFTAMQQAGVDLGGGASGELSGLQRGIQGVTEETAQIIEAYLNSVRFYVADSNTKLTQLVNQVVGGENTPNPILSELKTQTELVRGISTLLNSVVRGSHSMGGQGIKVFIS